MTTETDLILDRRRLKRRLFFWRILTVIAILVAIAFGTMKLVPDQAEPHVAKLNIENVIVENDRRQQVISDIAQNDNVKALIVYINSPGGSTYGSERLYHALKDVAQKKPVVTVIGTVGASGGYITALAGERIFAGETSITGSIGVIVQFTEISKLLDQIGVRADAITSGPLKGEPSPLKPLSNAGRRNLQEMVLQTHEWFEDLIVQNRPLSEAEVEAISDGRILIGKSAISAGLIDELGGLKEARIWLESNRQIPRDLPLIQADYSEPKGLIQELIQGILGKSVISERLTLDGLISLWHPN
ncbi:signal peptide peptidase SppA [Sneathiella glossodoripedis]|uniref:signal peptide peptidase SppA n=1 Tax=Sneathiella glossodoripedis TaxID=418853 RepID=UPI00046F95D3|nr:signal peptide peptidase SppA [Sneathiella glossodoripedis]